MRTAYYLPQQVLDNDALAELFPTWSAEKIYKKTGISERRIAAEGEFASDMAVHAARALFAEYAIDPKGIAFVILVTQSPDYLLPTTACMVQNRLGIPMSAGAYDLNLGCSGYIYGLLTAKALLQAGMVPNVLLITAEMYSKHVHPLDKSVRTIFGDGASASFLEASDADAIGQFSLGSNGAGYDKLIIPNSAMHSKAESVTVTDENGNVRTDRDVYMSGSEIFNFTIDVVPKTVQQVLEKNNLTENDIDLFVFHQANRFMLDHLRKLMKIDKEKFYIRLEHVGNTVSSSIPIALKMAEAEGKLKHGDTVMLVGFGVGLSWGATIITY